MRMGGHCIHWTISIHSLRMEGDFSGWLRPVDPEIFQSTPSAWRETLRNRDLPRPGIHFNPLPPHGGRHSKGVSISEMIDISIHSLRMEGDALDSVEYRQAFIFQSTPSAWRETGEEVVKYVRKSISIHSLRMEGDLVTVYLSLYVIIFQSTPSAWRETYISQGRQKGKNYFNPLPPHGGRHATNTTDHNGRKFQSTPSAWRETVQKLAEEHLMDISIHSLRMEGDQYRVRCDAAAQYFNPLPPHGGRPACPNRCHDTRLFQSTPSAWRETSLLLRSHAAMRHFNPLPPHGGRQTLSHRRQRQSEFQSTPSAWRETSLRACICGQMRNFNPLPPHGGRLFVNLCDQLCIHFNPLPPHGGRLITLFCACQWNLFQSTPSAWRETRQRFQVPVCYCNFNPLPPHGGRLYKKYAKAQRYIFQSTPSAWRETSRD